MASRADLQRAFLPYQHVFVFLAPIAFVAAVLTMAPLPASAGNGYWLEFWWLVPCFMLGATIVNTMGISGSAVFVPFLIFLLPLAGNPLEPEAIVKVGLISESFGLSSSALAFIQYGLVDRRLAPALGTDTIKRFVGGLFALIAVALFLMAVSGL